MVVKDVMERPALVRAGFDWFIRTTRSPDRSGKVLFHCARRATFRIADDGVDAEDVVGQFDESMSVDFTHRDCQYAVPLCLQVVA